MKPLIIMSVLGLGLSACLKVKDRPKDEAEVTAVQKQGFISQVQELPQINHYKVLFAFPKGAQTVQRRIKDVDNSAVTIPMKIQDGILTDDQVDAGKTYIYEAGNTQNGQFEVIESFTFDIPQDRLIGKDEVLDQDQNWTSYRRIFFEEGSTLTTNGHNLSIQADQIIAPDALNSRPGTIRTFPTQSQAAMAQNGLSGGLIQISLRTGSGTVSIELRGQKGGAGVAGQGDITFDIFKDGNSGRGGPIGLHMQCPECLLKANSHDGDDGNAGGSSGRAEITILEKHNLHFPHLIARGEGGEGGQGGRISPDGKTETFGVTGAKGAPGLSDRFCISDSLHQDCYYETGL